jgi:hypothetical protein
LKANRCSGGIRRLHLQGRRISRTRNKPDSSYQVLLVSFYANYSSGYVQRTARRYITEDRTLHNDRCENLNSYVYNLIWKPAGTVSLRIFRRRCEDNSNRDPRETGWGSLFLCTVKSLWCCVRLRQNTAPTDAAGHGCRWYWFCRQMDLRAVVSLSVSVAIYIKVCLFRRASFDPVFLFFTRPVECYGFIVSTRSWASYRNTVCWLRVLVVFHSHFRKMPE